MRAIFFMMSLSMFIASSTFAVQEDGGSVSKGECKGDGSYPKTNQLCSEISTESECNKYGNCHWEKPKKTKQVSAAFEIAPLTNPGKSLKAAPILDKRSQH